MIDCIACDLLEGAGRCPEAFSIVGSRGSWAMVT